MTPLALNPDLLTCPHAKCPVDLDGPQAFTRAGGADNGGSGQPRQLALGLAGDQLEHVAQELPLGCQLDHRLLAYGADRDPAGRGSKLSVFWSVRAKIQLRLQGLLKRPGPGQHDASLRAGADPRGISRLPLRHENGHHLSPVCAQQVPVPKYLAES